MKDCTRTGIDASRAQGKYVYMATSDDTMAPDCLEKLVAALERNPDCDLAHCTLRTIGSNGESVLVPVERPTDWAKLANTFRRYVVPQSVWSLGFKVRYDGLEQW